MKNRIVVLMLVLLMGTATVGCGKKGADESSKPVVSQSAAEVEKTQTVTTEADEEETETEEAIETEEDSETEEETETEAVTKKKTKKKTTKKETTEKEKGGISKDFKKTMDDYEEFMDEYVDFMKKYAKSDNSLTLLAEYAEYLAKYEKVAKDFDSMDEDELSDEELAYYIDVQARVSKKLLEVAN